MNHEPGSGSGRDDRPANPPTVTDDALGAMVRSAAERWTMPPQRLGAPTWRDRAARRRTNRGTSLGLGRPLVAAFGAAVVATVSLALVAVWLTTPRGSAPAAGGPNATTSAVLRSASASAPATGSTTAPATAPASAATANPSPTALPTASVLGPVADARVLVNAGGAYAMLDLRTGLIGPTIFTPTPGSAMRRNADGTFTCACLETTYAADPSGGAIDTITLTLRTIRSDGSIVDREVPGATWSASRPASTVSYEWTIVVSAQFDPSGDHVDVGWSALRDQTWDRGLDVIDVGNARIQETTPLASLPDTQSGQLVTAWEPIATVAPDGRHMMVQLIREVGATGTAHADHELFALSGTGSVTEDLGAVNVGANCTIPTEGWATADRYFVACPDDSTVRLVDLTRAVVATVTLPKSVAPEPVEGIHADTSTGRIFAWDPFGRVMIVIDAVAGRQLFSGSPAASAASGSEPLGDLARQIGRWLAPSAAAKFFLSPALVPSADGSRLFALGISNGPDEQGSSGIDVFDTRTLAFVGHWAPDADWYSMSLSDDGSQVYVAGLPGADASGRPVASQRASLTVLDATTGAVRAIFGQLPYSVDLGVTATP